MTFKRLIFSDQKAHKTSRHLLFWTVYMLDFLVQNITPDTGKDLLHWHIYNTAFTALACYLPIGIFSVYTGVYFLTPLFFFQKKYWRFAIGLLLLFVTDFIISYYATGIYLKLIAFDVRFTTFVHKIDFAYLYIFLIVIATVAAIGIKVTKRWYRQQEENLEINRQKTRLELQLQKIVIRPPFLFQTLDSIRKQVILKTNKPAGMVLGLSDILSYSLYDSELELVPLDMELTYLQEFIKLQHIHNEQANIIIQIDPTVHETYVPPMILLSLLQECFAVEENKEVHSCKIVLTINSIDNKLSVILSLLYVNQINGHDRLSLNKACSRLKRLYPAADFEVQTLYDKSLLTVRLYVPLITDPYAENNIYQHGLNIVEHDTA